MSSVSRSKFLGRVWRGVWRMLGAGILGLVGCHDSQGPSSEAATFAPMGEDDFSWVKSYEPTKHPQISLLTVEAGGAAWEVLGESALRVRIPALRQDTLYSFCHPVTPDPGARALITGSALFRLQQQATARGLAGFKGRGRGVSELQLNLGYGQATYLLRLLQQHLDAGGYRWQVLSNNCVTRARDALDAALDGDLAKRFEAVSPLSLRQQVARVVSARPVLGLGVELLLPSGSDRAVSLWSAAIVPEALAQLLQEVQYQGAHGSSRLVSGSQQLLPGRLPRSPRVAPDLSAEGLQAGVLVGVVCALLGSRVQAASRRRVRWAALALSLWSAAWGALGLGLLVVTRSVGIGEYAWAFNRNVWHLAPWSVLLPVFCVLAWKQPRFQRVWFWAVVSVWGASLGAGIYGVSPFAAPATLTVAALLLPMWTGVALAAYWLEGNLSQPDRTALRDSTTEQSLAGQ